MLHPSPHLMMTLLLHGFPVKAYMLNVTSQKAIPSVQPALTPSMGAMAQTQYLEAMVVNTFWEAMVMTR